MNAPPNREVALFSSALELPAGQRAAYLAEACADDPALRLRLEALLRVHDEAIPFLETPPSGAQESLTAAEVPGGTMRITVLPSEKTGDRIGRYKLLQQIGEGGCGVVYMAEQSEPVRRRVALKVIKLGMDTKQVIARFEAERQALALMDHPNIAKVLEAGATDTGRPYFVMELVRGIKITDFCDQNHLSTQDRLKLFIQVCQAIQHAHQKGIIHRDIKPSNILVADHDGVPVPKIIDFGIAKATTDQRLTDKTLFTAFEQFIGTPAYMSPEQAKLSGLDVDTRSDIYSLGVLLYELLTGQTPFDTKALMHAGLDEIRRTIREEEPVRPSTRLSTLVAADLTEVAKQRHAEPAKLGSLIRGDLDWIVMKALEKDRARRYETANGLASDIQRHLNSEPVVARPPSNLYRFQKLARRNRLVFAAAAAISTVLVLGVGVSTWQAIRATRAEREQSRLREAAQQEQANEARLRQKAEGDEKKAQTESSKSRQVAGFLKKMLGGVGPSRALGRDTMMLREILDETEKSVSADLTNQPEVEAELRNTIGEVYWDLGQPEKAEPMHTKALAIRRNLFGPGSAEAAESLDNLGLALFNQSKFAEAEKVTREALAIHRKLQGPESLKVARSLYNLGMELQWLRKLDEAEKVHLEALEMRRKLLGKEHPDVASSLDDLAVVYMDQGKLVKAEPIFRESLAMQRRLMRQDNPDTAMTLYNLADVIRFQGRFEEALPWYRECLALRKRILGDEHRDTRITVGRLADALGECADRIASMGGLAFAEPIARERLALLEKELPDDWRRIFDTRAMLGSSLLAQGKLAEAEPLLLSGYEAMKQQEISTNAIARLIEAARGLAQLYETNGQAGPAAEWKQRQTLAQAAVEIAAPRARGLAHARQGRFREAAAEFARVIELSPEDYYVRHLDTAALIQSGQLEAYRELRHQGVQRFGKTTNCYAADQIGKDFLVLPCSGPDLEVATALAETAVSAPTNHPDVAWFRFAKCLAEYRQGRFAGAVEWAQKVLVDSGHYFERDAAACLVLAMAQHQLKLRREARASLARGLDIVETKLPKLDSGNMGDDWVDLVFAHALLAEAKALIDGRAEPPSNQSKAD